MRKAIDQQRQGRRSWTERNHHRRGTTMDTAEERQTKLMRQPGGIEQLNLEEKLLLKNGWRLWQRMLVVPERTVTTS